MKDSAEIKFSQNFKFVSLFTSLGLDCLKHHSTLTHGRWQKKSACWLGNTERTRLGDWCQGDLGEKNVVETLVIGTKCKDITRGLRDDLFYRVISTFSVSLVLTQWFSEYSYKYSCPIFRSSWLDRTEQWPAKASITMASGRQYLAKLEQCPIRCNKCLKPAAHM